jgi:hypothetical protein
VVIIFEKCQLIIFSNTEINHMTDLNSQWNTGKIFCSSIINFHWLVVFFMIFSVLKW